MRYRMELVLFLGIWAVSVCSAKGHFHPDNALSARLIYTVQVASFPEKSGDKAIHLYQQIKENHALVYTRRVPINQKNWTRVKVGVFDTRQAALTYRDQHLNAAFPDAIVVHDTLIVRELKDEMLICTFNDIWMKKDTVFHALYFLNEQGCFENSVHASVEDYFYYPPHHELLFTHKNRLVSLNTQTGQHRILPVAQKDGGELTCLSQALAQRSPSGKQVAFIDCHGKDLWIHHEAQTRRVAKTCSGLAQRNILNMRWHPQKEMLFFVNGSPESKGGFLYMADTTGYCLEIAGRNQLNEFERISPWLITDDDYLTYQVALYDSAFKQVQSLRKKRAVLSELVKRFEAVRPAHATGETFKEKKQNIPKPVTSPDSTAVSEKKKEDGQETKKDPLQEFLM